MPGWGSWYWPSWLLVSVAAFLGPEIFALVTDWRDTLSNWVWTVLKISGHESMAAWNATDYLVFGCWLVLVTWLTGHFFYGIWR